MLLFPYHTQREQSCPNNAVVGKPETTDKNAHAYSEHSLICPGSFNVSFLRFHCYKEQIANAKLAIKSHSRLCAQSYTNHAHCKGTEMSAYIQTLRIFFGNPLRHDRVLPLEKENKFPFSIFTRFFPLPLHRIWNL